jgi:hypothetical protein
MTTDKLPRRATVAELSHIIGRSEKQVRECIHARKLTRGKDGKFHVKAVVEEHLERQQRNNHNKNRTRELTAPATWADMLKATQVDKLEVQIAELRGELVTRDEVQATLAEHSAAVRGALDNWVQYVAAEKRDADLLEWAEQARDRALAGIQESL